MFEKVKLKLPEEYKIQHFPHTTTSRKGEDLRMMLPVKTGFPGTDLLPVEKFGTETQAEKQIKFFLEKQLDTKISLEKHFAQHREFSNSSTFTPLTQLIHGECTLEKFKEVEEAEEKRQELQRSGLNKDEIDFLMKVQNNELSRGKGLGANPDALTEKQERIKKKLVAHEQELSKPEIFKNVKTLSRHEMEIEKTLYVGCDTKQQINKLVTAKAILPLLENDPFKQVKELSEKLSQKVHKKRKNKRTKAHNDEDSKVDVVPEGSDQLVCDPNIHHVIVPLEDTEISRKKLCLDEIRSFPRFADYKPGIPNKVLFLKNLHPKVDVHELQAIFGRFEFENYAPIHYRILSGRMRGQAFLEFGSVEMATKALTFANGYMLRDRPIIIQYGRVKAGT